MLVVFCPVCHIVDRRGPTDEIEEAARRVRDQGRPRPDEPDHTPHACPLRSGTPRSRAAAPRSPCAQPRSTAHTTESGDGRTIPRNGYRLEDFVDEVMNSPTGMAIIDVTYTATGSVAGTCALITLLLVLYFFGTCNVIAAASRQGWAFARYAWLWHHRRPFC